MKQESTRVLAKGQEISERNYGFLNFPKTDENVFLLFTVASKKWSNQKI